MDINELGKLAEEGLETMTRKELINICMMYGDYPQWHNWKDIALKQQQKKDITGDH